MRSVHPAAGNRAAATVQTAGARARGRLISLAERADRLATRAAVHPYRSILGLVGLNLSATLAFIAIGEALFADPAELFRELMPGTLLSFAELAFLAVVAWAIHTRVRGQRRARDSFWALSAIVFAVFAIDEITQLTIFLGQLLGGLGVLAPAGFKDLDAFLLVVMFAACGAMLLRYSRELLSHPASLALLAVGVALGAASQTLDSVLAATSSEFVAEESLKLAAEPFLIGGYLVVLHRVPRRSREAELVAAGTLQAATAHNE